MNIWANYVASWQQIFNYHGKTRRRDFWAGMIGILIATIVVATILSAGMTLGMGMASVSRTVLVIFLLAEFLQYLSMSVRRLHSIALPTNYQWLMLLPGVHMIILHALPEVDRDPRAPWYHMVDPDGQRTNLVVDRHGYIHGILGNAFATAWRDFFNFKGTVSRGNYLWTRVAWQLFGIVYGAALGLVTFIFLAGQIFRSIFGTLMQYPGMNPAIAAQSIDSHLSVPAMLLTVAFLIIASIPLWFPIISLTARRLHDQELNAAWVLLYLAGSIGSLILLLLTLLPAKPNQMKYPVADGGRLKTVSEKYHDEA
ncbi:DUF805 domain-containing protein [Furfurilactobacillus siliginis]|uniref:DUF805 domain-containing protein n=1 Tax=Furfurilactobacillus siliginis TaxID=348151 RepID=A0A0R2LBD0_9LACO|nr:DUF805 domain-containing protein [Furfurilactobacillus siliginis]KRN96378.1 hypothetical protein IV55_GL001341 [Furfurilactobacillus siliginis]GEK29001.1 hypothetical protein LSI01_13120 [Furfurilactobacillus siliginis]